MSMMRIDEFAKVPDGGVSQIDMARSLSVGFAVTIIKRGAGKFSDSNPKSLNDTANTFNDINPGTLNEDR